MENEVTKAKDITGCWSGWRHILPEQLQKAETCVGRVGQTKSVVVTRKFRAKVNIRAVMERDMRLTGKWREQSDIVKAPAGFEGE